MWNHQSAVLYCDLNRNNARFTEFGDMIIHTVVIVYGDRCFAAIDEDVSLVAIITGGVL